MWPGGGLKAQVRRAPQQTSMRVLPASVTVAGKPVQLWTFAQLTELQRPNLKQRALNLRDQVGSDRLPPLQIGAGVDEVVCWMIRAEVAASRAAGLEITEADLGMPAAGGDDAVHQLRPAERARMQAVGFDMSVIPAANLGARPTVAPPALLEVASRDVAANSASYDWAAIGSTTEERAYGSLSPEARKEATSDSAARGDASKARNAGSQVREALLRADPEGDWRNGGGARSVTKADYLDYQIKAADRTMAIYPKEGGLVLK
eukprot:1007055-Prymnesium_polylepis.1